MHTTASVPIPLQDTYTLLEEATRLLGLHQETRLIAHRKDRLTAPLTLGVVGPPHSDTRLIVDVILGRPLATRFPHGDWISVFQATDEKDWAEIVYPEGNQSERLPLEVAMQRLQAGVEVRKVVWHCTDTRLPENVQLLETTLTPPYTTKETLLHELDSLLVALPVERMPVALPMLEAVQELQPFPLPTVGVVTGMDRIPADMWEEVLRRLRQKMQERGMAFVPLAHTDDLVEQPPRGGTALYRMVKTRFFMPDRQLRETIDQQVVEQLKERVITHTEAYFDRVVTGYRVWQKEWAQVEEELEQRRVYALEQGNQFIQQLQEQAEERVRLMEQGMVSDAPPVIGEREIRHFLGSIQGQMIQTGANRLEHMASRMLMASSASVKHIDTREYLRHLYHLIPSPPVEVLSMLTNPMAAEPPTEVALFREGKGHLPKPREVAIWQHGREWVRKVAEQVRSLYRRWVLGMYDRVREQVKLQFDKLFQFFFHTVPERVADHLLRVEQLYEKIRGRKARVPAPHLRLVQGLSPVEFLLKAQEDQFVREWNRAWKMHCWEETSHRIHRWGREQIRSYRETLREEWQQAWDALHAYVRERWHREGWRFLLRGESRWSFQEVLAHVLKDRTPVPEKDLRLPSFGLEAAGIPFSALYLREEGTNFLQKQRDTETLAVDRELQRRLTAIWQKHLLRLSSQDFYIRLVLPIRKWVTFGGVGVTLLFVLLLVSGVNSGILFLLFTTLSIGSIAAVWLLPEVMQERGFGWLAYQQAEKLHQLVDRLLKDALTRAEQEIVHDLKSGSVEERVLDRIPEEVPGGFRCSYRTLQQRLVHWSAAA